MFPRVFCFPKSRIKENGGNGENHGNQHVTFDMGYHFAKPQANGVALLKKRTPKLKQSIHVYSALVQYETKWAGKTKFRKRERQMSKCFGRICYMKIVDQECRMN